MGAPRTRHGRGEVPASVEPGDYGRPKPDEPAVQGRSLAGSTSWAWTNVGGTWIGRYRSPRMRGTFASMSLISPRVTMANMAEVLAYVAAALVGLWGVSHAIPTCQVVAGFEPTTIDNHRVIVQEWLAEAFTMWGLAALVIAVTAVAGDQDVTSWVYRIVAALLVALGVLTALTGARTRVIWFKVCPVVLTSTAVLLVLASVL